jgi:hypothetical protein
VTFPLAKSPSKEDDTAITAPTCSVVSFNPNEINNASEDCTTDKIKVGSEFHTFLPSSFKKFTGLLEIGVASENYFTQIEDF